MMKKHTFFTMLCVLLVLTGCQKRQEQTDIRLPESESAVTEETITVPSEKPEEVLPEESSAKPAKAGGYPSAGTGNTCRRRNDSRTGGRTGTGERCSGSRHLQRASGSPSNAANTGGLEKQPGIRDDHGAKGKSSQSTDSQLLPRAGQPQSSGYRMGRP